MYENQYAVLVSTTTKEIIDSAPLGEVITQAQQQAVSRIVMTQFYVLEGTIIAGFLLLGILMTYLIKK